MQPTTGPGLDDLAEYVRSHSALSAKAEIGLVREVVGDSSWVYGPGDDGAVVPEVEAGTEGSPDRQVVVCGEALLPAFVARDPYGAGLAAVLANVNDLAAMGAVPHGIVDTIVGGPEVAREVLRGMRRGTELYDVALLGGHLTVHEGPPSVSAFGVGFADTVLSATRAQPGHSLVVGACLDGDLRADFPFFRSFESRGQAMAGDVRLLARLAVSGACVAAKDVSMAGLVGSVAMLLEWGRLGVTLDLEALPRPRHVSWGAWLTCFPAYCFLLCAPAERAEECVQAFLARGLAAAEVGVLDNTGVVGLRRGGDQATVLDLSTTGVTGLRG